MASSSKPPANIAHVKRKAISLLTTVYKTESEEQVAELEVKIKDLLHMIQPIDGGGEESKQPKKQQQQQQQQQQQKKKPQPLQPWHDIPLTPNQKMKHVGEIPKPMKQFFEQQQSITDKQASFLEVAMIQRKNKRLSCLGLGRETIRPSLERVQEMRVSGPDTPNISNRKKQQDKEAPKQIPGVIDISKPNTMNDDDDDDLSSHGTDSTSPSYGSIIKERMAGVLRVRRVVENDTAPSATDNATADNNSDNKNDEAIVRQDQYLIAASKPKRWRWLQRA